MWNSPLTKEQQDDIARMVVIGKAPPVDAAKKLGINRKTVDKYVKAYTERNSLEPELLEETKTTISPGFEKEWKKAVLPFKNVKWVKEGGKKLYRGGK